MARRRLLHPRRPRALTQFVTPAKSHPGLGDSTKAGRTKRTAASGLQGSEAAALRAVRMHAQ